MTRLKFWQAEALCFQSFLVFHFGLDTDRSMPSAMIPTEWAKTVGASVRLVVHP